MKNFKIILIAGGLIALLAIIGLIFLVLSKHTAIQNTNSVSNNWDGNDMVFEEPAKNYTYKGNGYSFGYPQDLQGAEIAQTYLPYGNQRINTDFAYFHAINTEYCAPSGKCSPTTQDFWFEGGVINSPINVVKDKLGSEAKTYSIISHEVTKLSQGVEGEGRNYYFVATPDKKTLMFSQKYIDENILTKYAKIPEFMKLFKQNQTMEIIIGSLKFNQ